MVLDLEVDGFGSACFMLSNFVVYALGIHGNVVHFHYLNKLM